MMRTFSRSRLW